MHQPDLIFDVGMHLGEDTDFYLKKGFQVVAFEAHPDFVQHCESRFSDEIAGNRLIIVPGAVVPCAAATVPFYVNTVDSTWGTLNLDWVSRNARRGAPSRRIEVARVNILEHFHRHGVPYYLKIDIEGSDREAARSLQALEDRPRFISIETDIFRLSRVDEEIDLLYSLGYRKFKPVQQMDIRGACVSVQTRDGTPFEYVFENGASGVFGDDLSGEWLNYRECRRAYRAIFARYWIVGHLSPLYRYRWHDARTRLMRMIGMAGWHDLHASL
jgi:FkbM family methyltransferase